MLSYEYAYMCMQMRADIIEKPNFVDISKTMHDNIMKLLSTHMFPWSRINIMSLKMSYCELYTPRCHAYHHVVLGMYRDTGEEFRSGCLSWSSIR